MKKLAIAGASVALAAMPVVGVFATDIATVTDTLQITVDAACSINAVTATTGSDDTTYSANVLNGKIAAFNNSSKHDFSVVCNNNAGWKVTAGTPNDLAGTGSNAHVIDYKAEALPAADSADDGQWMAVATGNSVPATAEGNGIADATGHIKTTGGIIATEAHSTNGSTFTVTYGAYVGTKTAADTYTGTIGYTLATL